MRLSGGSLADVAALLDAEHYIGSQCADPQVVLTWRRPGGLFGDYGEPCAAAVFAPPASKSWGPAAIELVRLVRTSDLGEPLSRFIGQCVRHLATQKRFSLVIAYADPSAGHHGGIYQASNFWYVGRSAGKPRYRLGATSMSHRAFTQASPRTRSLPWTVERTARKYVYLYPLTAHEVTRWNHKRRPYPKPEREL